MNDTREKPLKVLVLGGGVGAITAAFELTATEAARQRFEVTVLQHGWRLGGKGASGRGGDEARVQEHGLHLFMGFYDHAFQVMRQCYGELRPDPDERFQNWTDAFLAQRHVSFGSPDSPDGTHTVDFPKLPGTPGDPRVLLTVRELVLHWLRRQAEIFADAERWLPSFWQKVLHKAAKELCEKVEALIDAEGELVHLELKVFVELAAIVTLPLRWIFDVARHLPGAPSAWAIHVVELMLSLSAGLLVDVLPHGSFERINDRDFRTWLREYHASKGSLDSPLVAGLYDLAFAYPDGNHDNPQIEAGTLAKTLLRMSLTYRDAPLWRMMAGMGDVVFAPMYRLLEKRGVTVKLFHRVQSVRLSEDGGRVTEVEVSRQVDVKPEGYVPIKKVQGVYAWPAEPYWDQIERGDEYKKLGLNFESAWCDQSVARETLRVGEHFDLVVMGLSVGAFPTVCGDLIAKLPPWRAMSEKLLTVRTQAAQLWLSKTTEEMGFQPSLTVLSGGEPLFDSWGDMTHLLPVENWPANNLPKSIAYLCTVLDERAPDHPSAQAEVQRNLQRWLDTQGVLLWPGARRTDGRFDTSLLVIPAGAPPGDPLAAQDLRANIDPTERYVLSVPKSSASRMTVDGSGVRALYLAGDWVRTSINGGSSEAAFEAGVMAARAILSKYIT